MAMIAKCLPGCGYNFHLAEVDHVPGCPNAEKKPDLVQAQIDGVEFMHPEEKMELVSVPLQKLLNFRDEMNEAIAKFDGALELVPRGENGETNFGFYVDGYTMKGTPIIGEFLVTAMDGRTFLLKSSSLVAFLERRLEPNVFPEDKPRG